MSDSMHEMPVLIGHHFASHGMGEHIRCSFRAFQAAGFTLSLHDVYSSANQLDPDFVKEFGNRLVKWLSSRINIFYVNGDGADEVLRHVGSELPSGSYNIIYPTWELSIYPEEWAKQLNRFDEIWTPSKFVFDSISGVVDKPVFHMPLAVQINFSSFLGRRYFDLPESSYLFLFCFDFNSYIDRKNPFSVIEAFDNTCNARPNSDIRLVIKLNRDINSSVANAGYPRLINAINRCHYRERIIVIDKVLSDNEIKNLVRCSDCFVSLHRSEGFGRLMAEAMILGKPVIATGYSGNLDFMNEMNSCLVRYNLIDVREEQYPRAEGQVWADADIHHAATHMLKLLDDRNYGRRLGDLASRYVRTYFSYRAVGLRYVNRINKIWGSSKQTPPKFRRNNLERSDVQL